MKSTHHTTTQRFLLATAGILVATGSLTSSVDAKPPKPPENSIALTGFVRDFNSSHEDMDANAPDGDGHYAGNVSQVLGPDGAPLQVHGVANFVIDFGTLIPGNPYAARLTALGAEITSGGNPMPVTIQTETDSEVFEPYGLYNDPGGDGNINDGSNPRHFIYSLDDIYASGTPISVTATSWMPQFSTDTFGHGVNMSDMTQLSQSYQMATLVTLPEDGTVTSITARLYRTSGDDDTRYAIYTNKNGEPDQLIVESGVGASPSGGWNWYQLPINNTWLAAGDYWLTVCQDDDGNAAVGYQTTGSYRTRRFNNDGINGCVSKWTSSTDSWNNRRLAVYASYTSDTPTYVPYMTAKSGDNSPQVIVLRDGSDVPAIPGFQNQSNLAVFVEPYVNVATGKIVLQDNQAIYLFELGTSNLSSAAADFQDLVMLVTLATDPSYFYSPGTGSWDLDPIGFKVQKQWQDSDGNNIAPHLYTPSWGDKAGESGVTSSGGVTSPATFYQWFRDTLGLNLGQTLDIYLEQKGGGIYEMDEKDWKPIKGQLLGNEGGNENDNFTYALAADFTHVASDNQFIEFEGGDGCWIFIDDRLVLDLGGVKNDKPQNLDLNRLGLADGSDHQMRLFYANRGKSRKFRLTTNIFLTPGPILGGVTATFD